MMRRSVDLPPPLGPSSAVSSPRGMLRLTFSSATKSPNVLSMPRTSMLIVPTASAGGPLAGSCSLAALLGADDRDDDDAGHRDQGQQERGGVGAALVEVQVLLL